MRAGDLHDVSTVFGERAGTNRSSEDAGKVKDTDAREWPITGWQRLGGAVADAHDLHERQRCDRSRLRMSRPFRLRPCHAAGTLCSNDRLFEIGGVPGGNCACHCVAILRYAEHAECHRAMIGKIEVEIGPAPVPGRIEAHDNVLRGRNSRAGELNVVACCAMPLWPDEDQLTLADAARYEPATAPWPRARLQRELQHRRGRVAHPER
jgi:hypothetical protein